MTVTPRGEPLFLPVFGLFGRRGTLDVLRAGLSSLDSLVDKIKFIVATWVSILLSFWNFSIGSILSSWYEIAFSSALKAAGFSIWIGSLCLVVSST